LGKKGLTGNRGQQAANLFSIGGDLSPEAWGWGCKSGNGSWGFNRKFCHKKAQLGQVKQEKGSKGTVPCATRRTNWSNCECYMVRNSQPPLPSLGAKRVILGLSVGKGDSEP